MVSGIDEVIYLVTDITVDMLPLMLMKKNSIDLSSSFQIFLTKKIILIIVRNVGLANEIIWVFL